MTSTDETNPLIMVLDRNVGDFESCAFAMRRHLGDALDRSFAAWAVAPDRGRFIVYSPVEGFGMDQILSYADNEAALIYVLETRGHEIRAILGDGVRVNIKLNVAPDLFEEIGWRYGSKAPS